MGRSQVQRNRAARGRSGRGRGGRGGSDGRGGSSGGRSSSRRHKGGVDPRKLGNNDFRYERGGVVGDANGDDGVGNSRYDGLLDDINFASSEVSGSLGEYYGDSQYEAGREEEELADRATLSLSAATDASGREAEDWMSVDLKALDNCLRQIPISDRLKLPYHIGEHLENTYGANGGGGGRAKTLAELREESKFAGVDDEPEQAAPNNPKLEVGGLRAENIAERNDTEKATQSGNAKDDDSDGSDSSADDDDEGDLEAWLDDMIA